MAAVQGLEALGIFKSVKLRVDQKSANNKNPVDVDVNVDIIEGKKFHMETFLGGSPNGASADAVRSPFVMKIF